MLTKNEKIKELIITIVYNILIFLAVSLIMTVVTSVFIWFILVYFVGML